MRVVLGADHAGFALKQALLEFVRALGHDVLDVGAHDATPSDYPDIAEKVAAAIGGGQAERGILICGSGVGVAVAANKIPGIRAGICHDTYSAHQGVEHDDMNVLVLGARIVSFEVSQDLVTRFLGAEFSGEERHVRRLDKVKQIERRYCRST